MSRPPLRLDDLMRMDARQLHAILMTAAPLDPAVLAGNAYLGVDLSLPRLARRLLWHTFRKTFVVDEQTGGLRGWNVRMQQNGVDGVQEPLRDRKGRPVTFGHYRLCETSGRVFPQGWKGAHVLEYAGAGNVPWDPAAFAHTPLVAVNAGKSDLLLGWEVLRVGPWLAPLPLYWALRLEGPVSDIIAPPRPQKPQRLVT